MRTQQWLFMGALLISVLAACSETESTSGGSSSSSSSSSATSSSSTSSSSSASSSTSGSSSSGMGGGGGSGGGGPSSGYCAKGCAAAVDCCPMGLPNCPGNSYPTNYTCDNGVCGAPQCAMDSDCQNAATPNNKCVTFNGAKQCVTPCMADAECTNPAKCIGLDDMNNKFCKADLPPFMCTMDSQCNGFGKCNAAGDACECFADGDCTGFVNKCVLP